MADVFACSVSQNALGSVIGNLVTGIFTSNSSPITLVRNCSNNVENLKQKVNELKLKKRTAEDNVDDVHRRGEEIVQELGNWLTSANKLIEAADKLVADVEENAKKKCFFVLCLNPISRYQLSKESQKNSKAIDKLIEDGVRGFSFRLSHIPASPQDVAVPVKGFEYFLSRRDVLEKIMEALQSPSLVMIGVYGMAGVGKTMLAKEVKRKAEQDKLFDVVVMASVTKNAELKNIQEEIARGLGVDQLPNGITTSSAANLIKARLMKMKKALVILDDIWAPRIDLEELGIPLRNDRKKNEESSAEKEHTRCKILLTSRDRNVSSVNMDVDAQNCFPVSQLNDEEGLDLFKRITGDGVQSHELRSTAIEIVKECGGLPLAITTIANALRKKSSHHWSDASAKLQRPSPGNFSGISANIYSAIEVSYFHLESEELKNTFLLCSLMNGSIRYLTRYGMGLGLFSGINTLEKAKDRVLALIDRLKDSSLLLDGHSNMWFKMHDVVRDVAKSIASRCWEKWRSGMIRSCEQYT